MRLSLPPLEQSLSRGVGSFSQEEECVQLRSRVTSLESELADLTQRFTVLGQMSEEERAIVEASRIEASSRVDDLALRLLEAKSFIHSTLSLEYGSIDEPSKP